jgi:hypothetical protein
MVTTSQPTVPGADDVGDHDPPAPLFEPMSVRGPALIVLGLAVVILLGGTLAAALTSTGPTPAPRTAGATLSDGTHVTFAPATSRLRSIVTSGQPPTDILGSIGVLTTSSIVGTVDGDQGTTQFDRTVDLRTSALAQSQVVEAYRLLLQSHGWNVIYQGNAPQGIAGSTELLAKKGSSDGFYWEIGVVVSPTTATGSTSYSIEVFETPDGN